MNDTPANPGPVLANPGGMDAIANAATPIASMTPDAIKTEYETIQRELISKALTGHAKAVLLDRQLALSEARWPSVGNPAPGAPGAVLKGDASHADPKGGEVYEADLSGKNGHEAQQNAINARDAQQIRAAQADVGMTEAEIAEMEKAYEPKGPHEYKFPDTVSADQQPKVAAAQKLLFEHGVSPQVANLLIQGGDKLAALSDDAFAARTDDAVKLVKALPGGAKMVADAHAFLTGLPDGHPLTEAAVIATATEAGIRELARLQRRKARA